MSRSTTLLSLAVAALWAGCGGGCSGSGGTPDPDEGSEVVAGGEGGDEGSDPPVAVDPGPVPVLRVSGEPDPHAGSVGIRIENRGTEPAEVLGALGLQRRRGEAWEDVEAARLELRFSCEDEPPACVTLAPGAVYLPPAWNGMLGDAQCECERCADAEPGTYRFVARSCSRAHVVEGEPFTR